MKQKTATKSRFLTFFFQVKSIDDTSNFDDFPEVDLKIREHLIIIATTILVIVVISIIHPYPPTIPKDIFQNFHFHFCLQIVTLATRAKTQLNFNCKLIL